MRHHTAAIGIRGRTAITLASGVIFALALAGCSVAPGTQNTDPQPAKTVAAPGGGTIHETVAPVDPSTEPTVSTALDKTAKLKGGVDISIAKVSTLNVKSETPGEIAGPAVAVTLDVQNSSGKPIDLSTAMVTLTGAKGSYGQPTTSDPYKPFSGSISSGASATGTFVFRLPAQERQSLSITVQYVAGAPVALFAGNVK